MYNIGSGTMRLQIPDFLYDGNSNTCILQPILVKIASWKVDLENSGQGHVIEIRDLRHSIANINLHKSPTEHFCTSSYHLQVIKIFNFWRWNFRSRSWRNKRLFTPFNRKCLNMYGWISLIILAVQKHKKANEIHAHIHTHMHNERHGWWL